MRHGITLLEVLVVLVVSFFAVGLLIVFVAHHRENGLREQCKFNLKRIGEAFHGYSDQSSADEASKFLPPARLAEGHATWAVMLAPYLNKDNKLADWKLPESYFAQEASVREGRLVPYFCPAHRRNDSLSQAGDIDANGKHFPGGLGDYACVAGDGSADHDWTAPEANGALVIADILEKDERILKWRSRTSLELIERQRGTSYTLLAGEKHVPIDHFGEAEFGDGSLYNGGNPASFSRVAGAGFPLATSPDAPFHTNFGSYHDAVCHFLLADGSVRPLSIKTDTFILGEMARRGE